MLDLGSHTRMQVSLGALDVVVEVITKGLDQADCTFPFCSLKVSGEEHYMCIKGISEYIIFTYVIPKVT